MGAVGKILSEQEKKRARSLEEMRQQNLQKAVAGVNATFAGYDDPYFQRVGADYIAAQTPQLEDQYENARRALALQLSKGPGIASSAGARSLADLTKRYYGGQSTIAAGAEEAQRKARESISGLQRAFTEQAMSGADMGGQQAVEAIRLATEPPEYEPLANLFNTGAQYVSGEIRRKRQPYTGRPLTFNTGGSTGGTIVGGQQS